MFLNRCIKMAFHQPQVTTVGKFGNNSSLLISDASGNVKLSVLTGSTHVLPHCGLTNSKLRAHLPLVVPSNPAPWMRVAEENVTWTEGKIGFIIHVMIRNIKQKWHALLPV